MQKKARSYGKIAPFKPQYKIDVMAQSSRYSNERVEKILAEMVQVLESNQTPTDLSLMVLGNMVTNLLNTSVSPAQRQAMARSFADALQASVRDDQAH
ncbi:UPF0352 protein [Erwinia rhapontici]|nr:hypothetical protein EDF84_101592 [Erwinia rhapontici]BCQ35794.1 UPF0352 protein [Erwinia rhapontici]BCQ40706.1 UPF0352 protein [Erwinia rhapontici]BCQ46001.1 UPF0352 protein [Erwinia rhapontici]